MQAVSTIVEILSIKIVLTIFLITFNKVIR